MSNQPEPTHQQGQYLAFIYHYTKVNKRPPAERDIQLFFGTSPPSVHSMITRLHQLGFIKKEPGVPRSIEVLLPKEKLPELE
ncbi:MAG: LexA family protein [Prochlorotrichaceae cyanobacterium]